MCSKVCIKVMAMAQKHKIDNLEMVDWPAKAVHLDAVKTGDAARQSAFDKEAAEKNCAMKPGDTIKTCCEDGMTLSPGEAGGAPMCTGGGKPECVLWSTSGRRRRRLLFLGAPSPGPSICNSQEPASGPVPKPLAANSQRWTDKTTCTAAVTWKDESLKKLSPAEQAVAEASPAYKKPVFQTYVTGINPGTRVKFRYVVLFALNCLPSTVCPQLLFALHYCLPSTVCPQLSALNYCLPSTNLVSSAAAITKPSASPG
jgi:hypothetical protein